MNTTISRSTTAFLMLGATIGTVCHVRSLAPGNGSGVHAQLASVHMIALPPEGRRMARIVAEAAANSAAQGAHSRMLQIARNRDFGHTQNTIANAR